MTEVRGYTGKIVRYNGAEIREFIIGYAYPRNGNTHNPTPERCWHIFVNGIYTDRTNLLREARAAIDEAAQCPYGICSNRQSDDPPCGDCQRAGGA